MKNSNLYLVVEKELFVLVENVVYLIFRDLVGWLSLTSKYLSCVINLTPWIET